MMFFPFKSSVMVSPGLVSLTVRVGIFSPGVTWALVSRLVEVIDMAQDAYTIGGVRRRIKEEWRNRCGGRLLIIARDAVVHLPMLCVIHLLSSSMSGYMLSHASVHHGPHGLVATSYHCWLGHNSLSHLG